MPTYSFCCTKCGALRDVLLRVSEYGVSAEERCCGRKMEREYRPAQVVRDGYRSARLVSCLNSLDDDVMKDPPPFETRCEEKAYRAKHQEIFGWGEE